MEVAHEDICVHYIIIGPVICMVYHFPVTCEDHAAILLDALLSRLLTSDCVCLRCVRTKGSI